MPCRKLTVPEFRSLLQVSPNPKKFMYASDCEEECGICCVPVCGTNLMAQSTYSSYLSGLPDYVYTEVSYSGNSLQLTWTDSRISRFGPQQAADGTVIFENLVRYTITQTSNGYSYFFEGRISRSPAGTQWRESGYVSTDRFYQCVDGVMVNNSSKIFGSLNSSNASYMPGYCYDCLPYDPDLDNSNDGSVTCSGYDKSINYLDLSYLSTATVGTSPVACSLVSPWYPGSAESLGVWPASPPWPTSVTNYSCEEITKTSCSDSGIWQSGETCLSYDCNQLRGP